MRRNIIHKNIPRLLALLLAATLVFLSAPTAYADGESGSCGDNLTWSLSAGTLTISGSGDMTNFPESTMAPWYHLREEILRLELSGGITRIGSLAFYGCRNLTAVTIPDSVKTIGSYAFGKCSGLQLLSIGGGVTSIGEGAFTDCYALASLSIPGSVTSIGQKAFYRCESIPSVTIPASVRSLGNSAFGYCKSLISATVQAPLKTLPDFLFYGCNRLASVSLTGETTGVSRYVFRGCDSLHTVYSGGSEQTLQQIQQEIGAAGSVSGETPPSSVTSGTVQDNGDGTVTVENTTVTNGQNTTVSTTVEHVPQTEQNPDGYGAEINVTVENEEGWDEAAQIVQDQVDVYQDAVAESSGQTENIQVNVYVPNGTEVDPGFMENLAGQDVTVNVVTGDGSSWRVQGTELKSEDASGKYSLVYTLAAGTAELNTELGSTTSFYLAFHESSQVNTEVLIRLGTGWAQQQATLFQKTKDGLSQVQTVVVDQEGYAHFYLASVDKDTEYFIAMNLFAKAEQEAIVPDEMLHAYGTPLRYEPIKYEITGRTSSWGMGLGTVMTILAVVMVSMIVIVGFVMYAWNKRRLKMGYVPDLSEEDYEI